VPTSSQSQGWPDRGDLPTHETPSTGYPQRTRWSIRDSEATLILNLGALDGGTRNTHRLADAAGKPWLLVQLESAPEECDASWLALRTWLGSGRYLTLNIAGPRESRRPGIYAAALRLLRRT
jgi:Circularly permutated YpsA SLOG family